MFPIVVCLFTAKIAKNIGREWGLRPNSAVVGMNEYEIHLLYFDIDIKVILKLD